MSNDYTSEDIESTTINALKEEQDDYDYEQLLFMNKSVIARKKLSIPSKEDRNSIKYTLKKENFIEINDNDSYRERESTFLHREETVKNLESIMESTTMTKLNKINKDKLFNQLTLGEEIRSSQKNYHTVPYLMYEFITHILGLIVAFQIYNLLDISTFEFSILILILMEVAIQNIIEYCKLWYTYMMYKKLNFGQSEKMYDFELKIYIMIVHSLLEIAEWINYKNIYVIMTKVTIFNDEFYDVMIFAFIVVGIMFISILILYFIINIDYVIVTFLKSFLKLFLYTFNLTMAFIISIYLFDLFNNDYYIKSHKFEIHHLYDYFKGINFFAVAIAVIIANLIMFNYAKFYRDFENYSIVKEYLQNSYIKINYYVSSFIWLSLLKYTAYFIYPEIEPHEHNYYEDSVIIILNTTLAVIVSFMYLVYHHSFHYYQDYFEIMTENFISTLGISTGFVIEIALEEIFEKYHHENKNVFSILYSIMTIIIILILYMTYIRLFKVNTDYIYLNWVYEYEKSKYYMKMILQYEIKRMILKQTVEIHGITKNLNSLKKFRESQKEYQNKIQSLDYEIIGLKKENRQMKKDIEFVKNAMKNLNSDKDDNNNNYKTSRTIDDVNDRQTDKSVRFSEYDENYNYEYDNNKSENLNENVLELSNSEDDYNE